MYIKYEPGPTTYETYSFLYQPRFVCEGEGDSEIDSIYTSGGLPYSGDTTQEEDLFYMARSLRVDLTDFSLTSENRRILKKNQDLVLHISLEPKDEHTHKQSFLDFCETYCEQRFDAGAIDSDRLQYILAKDFFRDILVFRDDQGSIYGYVFLVKGKECVHYWFAMLDVKSMLEHNLGKWIMTQTIQWAKQQGYSHMYLGTCYGSTSKYKVRDFKGLEFRDGGTWNSDIKRLKQLLEKDDNDR